MLAHAQLAHAQNDELDTGPRRTAPGAERYCAVTGAVKPVAEMIRFVISPAGEPVPDLKRRLPGRGLWITATRAALRTAIARKVFARGFKRDVRVAPDFTDMTERLLETAALDALAIAHKAGKVAIGFAKTEAAITQGTIAAVLHATEAAADGVRKLQAALRRRFDADSDKVAVIGFFNSAQLDLALGRSNVIHAALLAGPESETFLARAARLDRFRASGTNHAEASEDRN
jgi:predicted RNA-binding protein YlxR (DUF448 family)